MEATQISIYGRALAEAQGDLAEVQGEIELLLKKKDRLEAFIANTEPLLPKVETASAKLSLNFPKQETPKRTISTLPAQPIWKSIVRSINGKGSEFTVKDALEALDRIGRGVNSPNRFQIVRAVLAKKTENFVKLGPGKFALKGKQKEASEEAS